MPHGPPLYGIFGGHKFLANMGAGECSELLSNLVIISRQWSYICSFMAVTSVRISRSCSKSSEGWAFEHSCTPSTVKPWIFGIHALQAQYNMGFFGFHALQTVKPGIFGIHALQTTYNLGF